MKKTYAAELDSVARNRVGEGHFEVAATMLKKAISLDPENMGIQMNLASTLVRMGKHNEAASWCDDVLEKHPTAAGVWSVLGSSMMAAGELATAEDAFYTACRYEEHNPTHWVNYAAVLMLQGKWDKGWEVHEKRLPIVNHPFSYPMWDGNPVDHLMVSCEQGVGDTIQFARYIPLVAERVGKVTFAVPANMYSLMQGYSKWATIIPRGRLPDGGADAEVLLQSLPGIFCTGVDNVPLDPGVLSVFDAPALTHKDFNVGICWAGNAAHVGDRSRSIGFKEFLPICERPEWDVYSFQVGSRSADIANNGAQALVTDLSAIIEPKWSAAATILKQMQAVVTCDTAIAHLAGALGIRTCLLVSVVPDWRWLVSAGAKTPWYPSVRVIRQKSLHNWGGCMNAAVDYLLGCLPHGA